VQADPAAILQKAQQHPLIVIDEGRPKVYVLSVDAFDALMERLTELEEAELATNVAAGEQCFAHGEFVSLKEASAIIAAKWQDESVWRFRKITIHEAGAWGRQDTPRSNFSSCFFVKLRGSFKFRNSL
jgi:PHD/YefM family antitoxin component YafN of YafNO toxin-antitoxin module